MFKLAAKAMDIATVLRHHLLKYRTSLAALANEAVTVAVNSDTAIYSHQL